MSLLPDFDFLVRKFDGVGVKAITLMGSYARGTAGSFSDIDLVRFVGQDTVRSSCEDGSYLINGFLVTVTSVDTQQIETWFSQPEVAVNVIAGIRVARPLLDRDDTFTTIQHRAQSFTWDSVMQKKANHWVSRQMVGWIEEVHKGLEGLRQNDIGRMLNARFGCSWGLSNVMGVQKGVLLSGDNGFYDEVREAVGAVSEWVRLRQTAFGLEDQNGNPPSLREQVVAGLWLYVVTAEVLADVLEPDYATLIEQTVELIKAELKNK